jgi:hypothetical protein
MPLSFHEVLAGLVAVPFIWVTVKALFGRPEEDVAEFKRQWPIHLFNLLPGPGIGTWLMVKLIVLVAVCLILLVFWYRVIGLVIS